MYSRYKLIIHRVLVTSFCLAIKRVCLYENLRLLFLIENHNTVVDIYPAAYQQGKYVPLFTDTEVNFFLVYIKPVDG